MCILILMLMEDRILEVLILDILSFTIYSFDEVTGGKEVKQRDLPCIILLF